MDRVSIFLYIISIAVFFTYIYVKYNKRKYILSIFNIRIYIYAFTLFIIGPFQFNDQAWVMLGKSYAGTYYDNLNEVIHLNLVGFIIFLVALIFFELSKVTDSLGNNVIKTSSKINRESVNLVTIITCLIWYAIVLKYNGTMPLFNANRGFANELGVIKTIYNTLNSIFELVFLFYAADFIVNKKKKSIFYAIICLATMLFTGTRGSAIIGIFTVSIIYLAIKNKEYTFKAIKYVLLLLIFGIALDFIRRDADIREFGSIYITFYNSILYGNTFSDVRDGAFVLNQYNLLYDGVLYGRTYLAALISFIPSSMIAYRRIWAYGSFTSLTLFGWTGHYGLRGGWFLEPYLNFGYIGIVIIAVLSAYLTSYLEKIFYKEIIVNHKSYLPQLMIVINPIQVVCTSILISSGFYDFYVYIIIIIMLLIISSFIRSFSRKFNKTIIK